MATNSNGAATKRTGFVQRKEKKKYIREALI
jgi:hypothetical protein